MLLWKTIIKWKEIMKKILCLLLLLTLFTQAQNIELKKVWEVSDIFIRPESVAYDGKHLYVSSINGGGLEKNGKGFISKLTTSGKIIAAKWLTKLNAPKGLATYKNRLYIADINELVVVDITNSRIIKKYLVKNAILFNDVASDAKGNIYTSDTKGNMVYKLDAKTKTLSAWNKLISPNGIFPEADGIVLTACPDENVKKSFLKRKLLKVSLNNRVTWLPKQKILLNIDGIEGDGNGGYFVTTWTEGTLFHYTASQGFKKLIFIEKGSADLEYIKAQKLIIIPLMNTGKLVAYKKVK